MKYEEFLCSKTQYGEMSGFAPIFMPDFLFDFQKSIVDWSIRKGRNAIFADCGLGKTPMFLIWADNIVRHTNKRILIVAPLAVSYQIIREGEKFGVEVKKSDDGKYKGKITVTNYERLHLFDTNDYEGVVCDESSILKNFNGVRKKNITEFLRTKKYRLLDTATASPNDYIELGTTSEALGELGYMDMLNRFFKNDNNTSDLKKSSHHGGGIPQWRFKKHAEIPFWKWICSWARAIRKPSDMGFDDADFILPELIEHQHMIEKAPVLFKNGFFPRHATGLKEQRDELRSTLSYRCEKAAALVDDDRTAVMWCHLNDEGDLLEKIVPDAVQVSGSDTDDKKESILRDFSDGKIRVLITKPKIAGFGLNWQHCNHMTFFPSHSFEQYYQSVRRCWRFGQKRPVTIDIVTTHGGQSVLDNMQKKSQAADKMFSELIKYMNSMELIVKQTYETCKMEVPKWL